MPQKHFLTDDAEHKASIAATKAWNWIKEAKTRTFVEWKKVGEGFLIGRAWAMRAAGLRAGTNLPSDYRLGRAYNEKFSEWLVAYKLDDIDQAAGTNLLKLMDSPAVLAWRNGLPDKRREDLNHPTTILRAYDRANRKFEPLPADEEPQKTAKQSALEAAGDAYQALRKENIQLQIEARKRCDVDLLHSDVAEIEKWLRARILSEHKARRLRDILNELCPQPLPMVAVTQPDGVDENALDETDQRIAAERTEAYNAPDRGPRTGDWCVMLDGAAYRFCSDGSSYDKETGGHLGNYYLQKDGRVSYSGALSHFCDIPEFRHLRKGSITSRPKFDLLPQTRPGTFWFGRHGELGHGNAVNITILCRVYKLLPPT